MKKTKVEPLQESSDLISENSLKRLNQKVWNQTIMVSVHYGERTNDSRLTDGF